MRYADSRQLTGTQRGLFIDEAPVRQAIKTEQKGWFTKPDNLALTFLAM